MKTKPMFITCSRKRMILMRRCLSMMGAMMRVWLLLSLWLEYNPLQFLLSFYPSRSCEIVYCICASTLCAVWSCLFCYALITSLLTGCQTALWSSDFTLFSIFLLGSLSVSIGSRTKVILMWMYKSGISTREASISYCSYPFALWKAFAGLNYAILSFLPQCRE